MQIQLLRHRRCVLIWSTKWVDLTFLMSFQMSDQRRSWQTFPVRRRSLSKDLSHSTSLSLSRNWNLSPYLNPMSLIRHFNLMNARMHLPSVRNVVVKIVHTPKNRLLIQGVIRKGDLPKPVESCFGRFKSEMVLLPPSSSLSVVGFIGCLLGAGCRAARY